MRDQKALAGLARWVLQRFGGGTAEEVEDAMSEAYLAAATRLRNDPDLEVRSYGTWFRRVLFLTCLDHGKRVRRNSRRFVDEIFAENETLEMIAAAPLDDDLRISIEQAMIALTEDDRQIIELAGQGYTSDEIGRQLAPPVDAQVVRKRKSRALKQLSEKLRGR